MLPLKSSLLPHKSARRGSAAPVPCAHLLVPQGEHLLHGDDPSASKAFVVLAHFDGLQPLRHRSEHGAVTAAGAGQADGHSVGNNVHFDYSSFTATLCTLSACDDHHLMANTKTNTALGKEKVGDRSLNRRCISVSPTHNKG